MGKTLCPIELIILKTVIYWQLAPASHVFLMEEDYTIYPMLHREDTAI